MNASTTKLVSRTASLGASIERSSIDQTPRGSGGRPRRRIVYLPRTDRAKLIDVFALTLLAAALTAAVLAGFETVLFAATFAITTKYGKRSLPSSIWQLRPRSR